MRPLPHYFTRRPAARARVPEGCAESISSAVNLSVEITFSAYIACRLRGSHLLVARNRMLMLRHATACLAVFHVCFIGIYVAARFPIGVLAVARRTASAARTTFRAIANLCLALSTSDQHFGTNSFRTGRALAEPLLFQSPVRCVLSVRLGAYRFQFVRPSAGQSGGQFRWDPCTGALAAAVHL